MRGGRSNCARLLVALVFSVGSMMSAGATPADTILMNGKIYSGKVKNPWSQGLAILDGQFSYVGDDVSALIGPNTVVYDLNGRTVIPSLLDGHSHPGMVALSSQYIELDDTSSKPRLMASIAKMVEENPDVPVLIGGFGQTNCSP